MQEKTGRWELALMLCVVAGIAAYVYVRQQKTAADMQARAMAKANQGAPAEAPAKPPFPMPPAIEDSPGYEPQLQQETAGGVLYRFSDEQIKRMKATELDRETFLAYLEARWPVKKLLAYCAPERLFTQEYQNLVPDKLLFDTFDLPVHDDERHKFDKIFVYVGEEDWEHSSYYGDAGKHWRRWAYSLNILSGDDHWAIIENLPNDLMDQPAKYGVKVSPPRSPEPKAEPSAPATGDK